MTSQFATSVALGQARLHTFQFVTCIYNTCHSNTFQFVTYFVQLYTILFQFATSVALLLL